MKTIIALFSIIFSTTTGFSQTVIVKPNRFAQTGWEENEVFAGNPTTVNSTTALIEITCDPKENGSQRGSAQITLPTSTMVTLRRTRLRNNAHHGTYLRDIAGQLNSGGKLAFSTYIIHTTNHSAPALVLQVDNNLDDIPDYNIVFSPTSQFNRQGTGIPAQENVQTGMWQEWNASMGYWEFGDKSFPDAPQPHSSIYDPNQTIYFTLADYVAAYPDARIANSTQGLHKGGGIRITVGIEDPNNADFNGYIDLFTIKEAHKPKAVMYDFKSARNCPVN